MSKIQPTNKGDIQSVSLKTTTGLVTAFVEDGNLKVRHGRNILDKTPNVERGEILGRLLDIADGGGFGLVFPALNSHEVLS